MATPIEDRIAKAQAEVERLRAAKEEKERAVEDSLQRVADVREDVENLLDAVATDPSVEQAKSLRGAVAEYVVAARKAHAVAPRPLD